MMIERGWSTTERGVFRLLLPGESLDTEIKTGITVKLIVSSLVSRQEREGGSVEEERHSRRSLATNEKMRGEPAHFITSGPRPQPTKSREASTQGHESLARPTPFTEYQFHHPFDACLAAIHPNLTRGPETFSASQNYHRGT